MGELSSGVFEGVHFSEKLGINMLELMGRSRGCFDLDLYGGALLSARTLWL